MGWVAGLVRPPEPRPGFRPELEGLRGLGVMVVFLYHAQVPLVTGGYVTVDLFFVLSGFLITGMLLRDLSAHGRLRLAAFYARRARRIVPMASLVLVCTLAVGFLVMPVASFRSLGTDAAWASLDAANFRFAIEGNRYIDSFAVQGGSYVRDYADFSPVTQYWSLSAEEQFYFAWPLLIVAFLAVAGVLLRRRASPRSLLVLVSFVAALSFTVSAWLTPRNEVWAYFTLPTRAFELAAGAALALLAGSLDALGDRLRSVLTWAGVCAIVASILLLDQETVFPGMAAALPVAGTAAVIAGGGRGRAGWLLSLRPCQALGRWTYSIFLWHWPVIVFASMLLPLTWQLALLLLPLVLALSAATFRFVENPMRFAPSLMTSPARTALACVAMTACALAAALVAAHVTSTPASRDMRPAGAATAAADPAAVARATGGLVDWASPPACVTEDLRAGLTPVPVPAGLRPSLVDASTSWPDAPVKGCNPEFADSSPRACPFGVAGADKRVVVVGDSHASMWLPALDAAADQHGWELLSYTKSSCPLVDYMVSRPLSPGQDFVECRQWRQNVLAEVARLKPDLLVLSSRWPAVPGEWEGYAGFSRSLSSHARSTLVLGLFPRQGENPDECLSLSRDDVSACSVPVDRAVSAAGIRMGVEAARLLEADYVDVVPLLCVPQGCPTVVGDVLLYQNFEHLSVPGSLWLAPVMEDRLLAAMPR